MKNKGWQMNNFWKKGIALASLCSLFLGMVGCGEKEQPAVDEVASDAPAWERYADTPITLDWYIDYSWFVGGWGENLVSKTITEETGVSVNFVTPKGNEEEMLNSMISSDSLPDLITLGWWDSQVNTMINSDMVYALNELADEYDAYFYEVMDPVVVSWYTNSDGNIYCYPNSSCTPQDVEKYDELGSNQTFLVRKDIYEAIGCPDMTTIEGFSAAVKKAVEMYPEVDGKPLIPIGAHEFDEMGCVSFDKYLMNFLAVPREEDGVYYDRYTDPEYLRWLKAFRQLGQEGYLADCIFTDTRTQMSEKIAEGRYFCMLYQRTDLADQQKLLYADNPDSIYIAVDGPRNSRGDDYVLPTNSTNGWTVTLISKNCKNPERAIGLMDYMLSEHGQKVISLGVEGEMYDVVDGEYVIREEVLDLMYSDREEYNRIYGADNTYWMLQNNVMQLEWMPGTQEPLLQMEEWTYPYTQYQGQYEVYISEDSQVGNVYTKINTLWSKTLPQLLLADSDEEFDAIMESFVEEREALGFELLVEEETRQMHENMERLGME